MSSLWNIKKGQTTELLTHCAKFLEGAVIGAMDCGEAEANEALLCEHVIW